MAEWQISTRNQCFRHCKCSLAGVEVKIASRTGTTGATDLKGTLLEPRALGQLDNIYFMIFKTSVDF